MFLLIVLKKKKKDPNIHHDYNYVKKVHIKRPSDNRLKKEREREKQ